MKAQLDAVESADRDQRSVLEAEKAQLEADRQTYMEKLRAVEDRLSTVEKALKNAEKEKQQKVQHLREEFLSKSSGLLLTAS